jgi:EpsI family protein
LFELWLLSRVGKDKLPFREAFAIEMPDKLNASRDSKQMGVSLGLFVSFLLLTGMAVTSLALPHRDEIIPKRATFKDFPVRLGAWRGHFDQLDSVYVKALKFDDYLLADYSSTPGKLVNLYVAYYGSQRKGASVHSPKACLPGGGWRIEQLDRRVIGRNDSDNGAFAYNRAVIQLGNTRQLVYYWFQERGRNVTNDYLVKWYLFWDAVTQRRTDGALVRLTTNITSGQNMADVDKYMTDFVQKLRRELPPFVPD